MIYHSNEYKKWQRGAIVNHINSAYLGMPSNRCWEWRRARSKLNGDRLALEEVLLANEIGTSLMLMSSFIAEADENGIREIKLILISTPNLNLYCHHLSYQ